MIPLRVDTSIRPRILSVFLILLLVSIQGLQSSDWLQGYLSIEKFGLVPIRWWSTSSWELLGAERQLLSLFTYAYLHDDWPHCLVNVWWLFVFGPVVHARFGALALVMIYTVSGLAGGAAYLSYAPESISPLIGASANISGLLGAYLVGSRHQGVFLLGLETPLKGGLFVCLFLLVQIILSVIYGPETVGVAFGSHVVGCVVGVFVSLSYTRHENDPEHMIARGS